MRQAWGFSKLIAKRNAGDLARDQKGAVLPIAAIGVFVGAIVVGSAVDLGRNYMVREQLQSACDAGVLAGRRTVTTAGFDAASKTAATSYFNTNFSDAQQGTRLTTFDVKTPDEGQTIQATATTTLDTLLMRIFGKDNFLIQVNCASSMGVGNSDIMMVLDTTGSMDFILSGTQTRIQALRAAMKNFYTTVYNATAASNARVRYGFVPFSSTVNVGRLITALDSRYIVDNYNYQSREWTNYSTNTTQDTATQWSGNPNNGYGSSWQCNSAMPSNNTNWSNNGSPTSVNNVDGTVTVSQRQNGGAIYTCQSNLFGRYFVYVSSSRTVYSYWRYYYKQMSIPTDVFKTFTNVSRQVGDYGAMVNSTWGGCIQERSTVSDPAFSYSPLTGISPKAAKDLDLDSAPDPSDDSTKWAPLWPEVSYRRWTNSGYLTTSTTTNGDDAGSYCPAQARQLGTMTQSAFNAYADSLQAVGGTYLDIGMIWGGRLMSPQGMWSSLVNDDPSNGGKVSRHIIFMTDGQMEPNYSIAQAWGIEYWDRRVTDDGYSNDAARHTSRFLASCAAIKDKGIRIWVVAFTAALSDDLKTCASDDSSFTADSSADLNAAFQEIAKQVGELRVTQ